MKQLKLWIIGLSMVLAGCQTTSHLSALKPQTAEAYSRFVDQPFAKIKKQKKPVVALVLGSGGARGYAHIGVIEVLDSMVFVLILLLEPVQAVLLGQFMRVEKHPMNCVILH